NAVEVVFVLVSSGGFDGVVSEVDFGRFGCAAFHLNETGDESVAAVAVDELVSVLFCGETQDVHAGGLVAGDAADADGEARGCIAFLELHCFVLAECAVGDPACAAVVVWTGGQSTGDAASNSGGWWGRGVGLSFDLEGLLFVLSGWWRLYYYYWWWVDNDWQDRDRNRWQEAGLGGTDVG